MKNKTTWDGDFIIGTVNIIVAICLLFNGFTNLAERFLQNGEIIGGATKEKGFIAFLSILENSWGKYLLIIFLFYTSYRFYKDGFEKFKKWRASRKG